MISVYWTNLAEITPAQISHFESVLSDSDKQRYQKMRDEVRRLQFLVGRALIWAKCGQAPTLLENGKPVVQNGYISLSHSGNRVALAVSENPVGLDVEKMLPRTDYEKIAKRLNFQLSEDKMKSFYRGFTRFEAIYKSGMKEVSIAYRQIGEYLICLASSVPNDQIDLIQEHLNYL